KHNKNNLALFLTIIFILFSIFLILNPNSFGIDNGKLVIIDNAINVKFNICILIIAIASILFIFINRKIMNWKKLIPIFITVCLWIFGILFVFIDPTILVGHFIITISSFIMYFTIENPDLKLINQLTLAKNEAEKASQAKSDFLSSMSHELRTPLNAIVGLSSLLKDEYNHDEVVKDADDILRASNNLLELVDGILEINQLDSNNMEIVNANYNPYDLFNSIEKNTKMRIGDKPIEFRCRVTSDIPNMLYGDKNKLRTIINNLLSNAVKYTEKGYVDFDVNCIVNDNKCNLRITISDTGRGIKEDQKEFLFTKFYRLEEDKDSDIEGTGLGLSITKSLVELLGGEISVHSTEGMGTTFTVTVNQEVAKNMIITDTEIL
ncbi:MAG: ATP-binding protein, partial [Bacilli bacterium]|nr:ATP-binding protein [Bacilli bacterium]